MRKAAASLLAGCALLTAACSGQTGPVTNITSVTATLNGNGSCGTSDQPCWYDYGYRADPDGSWSYTAMQSIGATCGDGCTTGIPGITISGLRPGTKYDVEFCALPGKGSSTRPSQSWLYCTDSTGKWAFPSGDIRAGAPNQTSFTTLPRSPLPADTWNGLHFATIFDYSVAINGGVKTSEAGATDFVWGGCCTDGPEQPPGVWSNIYLPWSEDPYFETTHTGRNGKPTPLQWMQENHPDWIEYLCNRKTPAVNFGQTGFPYMDITNPAVQQYVEQFAERYLAQGFNGVSWDGNPNDNMPQECGHYDSNGHWVQQYSGSYFDATYAAAQEHAFNTMAAEFKAQHPNADMALNQRFECDSQWQSFANTEDVVLDEGGFTMNPNDNTDLVAKPDHSDGCTTDDWLQVMQGYEAFQNGPGAHGLVLDEKESYSVTPDITGSNLTARADLEYALANYFLIKYHHTYFWWGSNSQYGTLAPAQAEYAAANTIGHPTDDFYASQRVYMRDYSNGLVLVNPAPSSSYTVTLNHSYQDLRGNPVRGSITLGPHSGAVLLNS